MSNGNEKLFEADVHYQHEALVSCVAFDHTRWFKSEDGEMVSLLRIRARSRSIDGLDRQCISEFNIWDVTPKELRELAGSLVDAAHFLEKHLAQVGQGGAS